MKIFIAHYSYSNDISGATNWLIDFIDYFRDKHDLFVYLRHSDSNIGDSNLADWLISRGVEFVIVKKGKSIANDVELLIESIRTQKPDIFLPQCIHSNFMAGVVCGLFGLPWIFTLHSDDEDYWSFLRAFDPSKSSGQIVSVSKYLGEKVGEYSTQSEPIVIPCGVAETAEKATWSEDKFNVVYSGRLVILQKRLDLVIQTMIELCNSNPRIYCTVIGDGSYREIAQKKVAEADLTDRIQFTGRVERTKVSEYLSSSHVFLMMSDFEGLPVALMEAMEKGVVPAVRGIKSGIPELVDGTTGYLVDEEIEKAVDAILKLANNQHDWELRSVASINRVNPDYLKNPNFLKWESILTKTLDNRVVLPDFDSITLQKTSIPKQLQIMNDGHNRGFWTKFLNKLRLYLNQNE
jgi:colanic acid/amylovoran biosynthesis glycosyltransferase